MSETAADDTAVEDDTEATVLYSSISRDGIASEETFKESEKEDNSSLRKYFELLAYAGGLWIFITQFVVGPFARLFSNE